MRGFVVVVIVVHMCVCELVKARRRDCILVIRGRCIAEKNNKRGLAAVDC